MSYARTKHTLLSAFALTVLLSLTLCVRASAAGNENTFTFLSATINAASDGNGYEINGTSLTITEAGTYTLTGNCANGSVSVETDVTGVTLILNRLTLASATTAPLTVGKNSQVTVNVVASNALTDNESASDASAEGAAIKVKSGAGLTVTGSGTLNVHGSCKNGIKGASKASVVVRGGVRLVVDAANNGIASDGSVKFDGGTTTVTASGDGVKSEPDADDTDSAGTVAVNAGSVTITAQDDGIQASNGVTVSGGTLTITSVGDGIASDGNVTVKDGTIVIKATGAGGDGIQSAANIEISGGSLDITTFGGYQKVSSLGDASAKGIKASSDVEEPSNLISISGGTFTLNTADDAIHSDYDVTITGGQFAIHTGDDGAHADSTLTLGAQNGKDPMLQLKILSSYEGLEGNVVNILSGCYDVTSSDDGINAAGGSLNGYDPGGPAPGGGRSNDSFRPRPSLRDGDSDAAINISGGIVTVNANGDGLDANGNLNLTGGHVIVWGQQAGYDNSPLDYDGTLYVKGGTVFAAGGSGMGFAQPTGSSQLYVDYRGSNITSGKTINVKDANSKIVCSVKAVKSVNYVFFSSPSVVNGWSITAGSTTPVTNCDVLGHTWDSGTVTKEATCAVAGSVLYTCAVCGATETASLPLLGHHYVAGICTRCGAIDPDADPDSIETVVGYSVAFDFDHASAVVYTTQDMKTVDASGVYYARHGESGNVVINGDGQSNFVVQPETGYRLLSVAVSPSDAYGELVTVDAAANAYRITNISGDVTVTAEFVSNVGFFYEPGEESALVRLGYLNVESVQADASYWAVLAWYDDAGRFLQCRTETVALDADKYAELSVAFPETFAHCYVFLTTDGYVPRCAVKEIVNAEATEPEPEPSAE